ncbi:lon-like ATP-dependent protease [Puccinia graminis f. sp. tritici CRL 75-36-700-3]|uniref:Lon protease homolog, mitochondrial n=1 Tax=Puccinia graminis f. sp. tritici (strain CRL 75-36-700-3 / race SCCL) TaxID=418459 RepID=H6QQW1_PUCGT|nr:lon-like ATP-dependent protease [Puccinia graminis f. sp. tritici CRL 75-36-700-3]EHS62890.1 lon-like ATP-dependent protease [Puccinia graminis f. sp. tritici CRL 75-36-700-3]
MIVNALCLPLTSPSVDPDAGADGSGSNSASDPIHVNGLSKQAALKPQLKHNQPPRSPHHHQPLRNTYALEDQQVQATAAQSTDPIMLTTLRHRQRWAFSRHSFGSYGTLQKTHASSSSHPLNHPQHHRPPFSRSVEGISQSSSGLGRRTNDRLQSTHDLFSMDHQSNQSRTNSLIIPSYSHFLTTQQSEPYQQIFQLSSSNSSSKDNPNNNQSPAGASSGNPSSPGGQDGANSNDDPPQKPPTSISKPTIPEVYPEVLALPITRRPLFPGFYKAVIIKNPDVIKVVREMMKRGQPYLGAFLLKNSESETDIISDPESVYKVGVFAQITSIFPTNSAKKDHPSNLSKTAPKDDETDEYADGLTAVLYPHRRIEITELLVPEVDPSDPAKVKHSIQPVKPTPIAPVKEDLIVTDKLTDSLPETSTTTSPNPSILKQSSSSTPKENDHPTAESDEESLTSAALLQTSFLKEHQVSLANVKNLSLQPFKKNSQVIRAIASEIINVFRDIATLNPLFRDQIANFSISQGSGNVFEDPDKLADFAAAVSTSPSSADGSEFHFNELQEVLESMVLEERLQKALFVLKQELKNAELQSKISREVESRITKRQREFYLMEQLKGIKKELGIDGDGKDKLIEKFKEKAHGLNMPEYAKSVFDEELSKLQTLEPQASEFNVTRNYLDWLTSIPWGRHSEENFDLQHAIKVLDEDHYGLKDVKDRILEFLAVGKLRGTVEGKILCLVGPPGVGKTSIGKSIARALDRQFFRFSVGGLTDVAEIKGHRRTYVGAMPGKVIQSLKKVQTENPLILIDEIDKVGKGHNGDPSSALLEMLDPEQNSSFLDHYIDIPINLSRVLFVCTANVLDTIPAPLLDRMEVLEVSGYVTDEKINIASKYLSPQAKESCGFGDSDVSIDQSAIDTLIRYYCRESGVRKLKQNIEKVYRKAALKIVRELGEKVLPESSAEFVSPPNDTSTVKGDSVIKYDGDLPASQSSNESSSSSSSLPSSSLMPIEVKLMPGSSGGGSSILLTGKLGEVIRESAQIGLSFLKSNARNLGLTSEDHQDLLEKKSLHLHMPEGSIGKEGPSAGTAILVAYLSLFSNFRIRSDLAMTGEMTLAGQVLPVGGLKEKILAAHRAGIKKILVPAANKPDIEHNVPDSIKEGIEIVYVEDVREVIKHAFHGHPKILNNLDKLEMVDLSN